MNQIILANIFALIKGITSISVACAGTRTSILLRTCIDAIVNIIVTILLGEIAVVPILIVGLIRNIVYIKNKKKWVPFVFLIIILIMIFYTYSGIKFFLVFGYSLSTLTYAMKDVKYIKLGQCISHFVWIPWNFYIKAYTKVLTSIIIIIILIKQYISKKI